MIMDCREAESLVTAGVYGRLTPEERATLEGHARTCPACSALLEKWAGVHELRARTREDDVPLPDWEKSWARIAAGTVATRRRRRFTFGRPALGWPVWARRAAAAASVILIFAAGYFAGRRFISERPGEGPRTTAAAPSAGSAEVRLAEYADELRPLLADFLNRGDVRPPEGLVEVRRRLVRDMLGQTRLLKGLVEESGDAGLKGLLSDLELILTSLANMGADDKDSADQLARMIRERDISPRLRDLAAFSTI
jgi:hypothetical protein